ncbi:sensor histidine kinase [Chryseolinea lacunae]|uniref:histidine kinase n=1 Tax=Chryseolinea lacunae TaxID=2801331 RepID=A0ABS1KLN6_9BACT|nr:ATP-binding protein [Chryseolinea lacunae]MBL0740366.1 ATP-binding protein [Chryseolinea lacunae]
MATSAMRPKNWVCRVAHYTGELKPMVFKKFRINIVLRVALLTACILLLAWCVVQQRYLRSAYLGVALVVILVELVWYIDRFNRDMKVFMTSLLQRDFTTHFQSTGRGKSQDDLYETLNQISEAFKKISTERETQFRYLEMLVEHVRVSILSIDADGNVHLANQALKNLLQKNILPNIKALELFGDAFVNTLREIRSGETLLVKLRVNQELLQLSLHAAEFKLQGRYYKLISMQNIRSELDAREVEAWQKLIRVLGHEIMNSVSPITSLSATLHGMVTQNQQVLEIPGNTLFESLDKGLEAIKIRSEGLYNFTQTYRKLTGIPKHAPLQTDLKKIVARVQLLLQSKLADNGVTLSVHQVDVSVFVDPELMEHVLINLILNAIDALANTKNPVIEIKTSQHQKGNTCIHVIDNGEGMDDATLEKIFIPFFTTRKHGSGIGLAITKQILQLHRADIQVISEAGNGTEFKILL